MTKDQALQTLKHPCNATVLLVVAKALGIKGVLVKRFRTLELRSYELPMGWENTKIRCLPSEHIV